MEDNYYFKEKLDKIDSIRQSIRFYEELVQKFESDLDLEQDNEEEYEKKLNNINDTEKYLEILKQDYQEVEEEFNTICLFTTNMTLSFLVRILNDTNDKKFDLVDTGNEFIITSLDKEEKYTFPKTDTINLYEFLMSKGALIITHPELNSIIQEILNLKAHDIFIGNYKEMRVFQTVYACMPANHADILKSEVRMHPKFKSIINEIASKLFRDDRFYDGETKDDYRNLYRKIIDGEINQLMDNNYWFGTKVGSLTLISLEVLMRKYNLDLNLTPENYIVYARVLNIINHVDYLDKNEKYYISINGHTQTKATKEERKKIDAIVMELLSRDYTWREAREMNRAILRLDYSTDYEFPHKIDGLEALLDVEPNALFDKIEDDIDLKSDTSKLYAEAERMLAKLHALRDIKVLFNEDVRSPEEAYLRRQVLANWDMNEVFRNNSVDTEAKKKIQDELIKGTKLNDETLDILFKVTNKVTRNKRIGTKDELVDLACGTLKSFMNNKRIENLYQEAKDIQSSLGIKSGTVYYTDINTLNLPNGDRIVSTYYEDIKPRFASLQKQYEYLYDNATDAEFLEGAIEIYGDIVVMQVFREGNKRTAKSVFNAMLLSRGIIPPVNDLNEQNGRLFLDIAYGRKERYMKAKYKLLLQTVDVKRQFMEKDFHEPLSIEDMENWRKI